MQHTKFSQICTSSTFRSPPIQLLWRIFCNAKIVDRKVARRQSIESDYEQTRKKEWMQNSYQIFVSDLRCTGARWYISSAFVRQPDSSYILCGCICSQWIRYLIYISQCVWFFYLFGLASAAAVATTTHIIPQLCFLISCCRLGYCVSQKSSFCECMNAHIIISDVIRLQISSFTWHTDENW